MKKLLCVSVFILLFLSFPVKAAAEGESDRIVKEQLEESGLYRLFDYLPEESGTLLPDDFDAGSAVKMGFKDILTYLRDTARQKLSAPLSLFLSLMGVILLSALVSALDLGRELSPFLSSFAVCGVMAPGVFQCFSSIGEAIEKLNGFVTEFIPVFVGVCAVSGKAVSSMVYQATIVAFIELYSAVAFYIMLPMISVFLALSVCGAFAEPVSLDGLAKGIKTFVTWLFGISLTVFSVLVTIKTLVSGSADAAAVKATKFLVSSFVPVVGSTLNDAYSTVYSCLGVVKNTVGIFGILALAFAFLPILIEPLLMLFALKCAGIVGEILSEKKAAKILDAAGTALSSALGIVFSYQVMIVISIAIMLLAGGG